MWPFVQQQEFCSVAEIQPHDHRDVANIDSNTFSMIQPQSKANYSRQSNNFFKN